jgi:hypothetical protein
MGRIACETSPAGHIRFGRSRHRGIRLGLDDRPNLFRLGELDGRPIEKIVGDPPEGRVLASLRPSIFGSITLLIKRAIGVPCRMRR